MMKRRGYLGLLVVIVCMALTMSACGKKTEETTNKVNFWASSHIWLREVQDAFTAEDGAMGEISHKDYVFYRKDEDAYIGIQSAENGKRWMLLKMEDNAIASKGFLQSLGYSLLITITSVAAILICCSMCAWYITRVKGKLSKILYYLFVFSMVVPFQMVMFTLSQTADSLSLNKPWNIWIIYLGFGAGLAVFMFAGFMKSIPLEVEEASMIDGCNPLQTFFLIVLPMLKPTLVSVGILEAMWVWNDYLLPTLVLDIKNYKTIPMLIQYFRGSYGKVEMGPMMASIMLTVIPIVIVYLLGQKHIIKGVAAGAVKG